MNEKSPPKGHGYGQVPHLNFKSTLNYHQMAKARDFKLCTLVRHVMV